MVVCRDLLLELGLAPEEWTYSGRSLDGWAGGISRISPGEFSLIRRCSIIVTGTKSRVCTPGRSLWTDGAGREKFYDQGRADKSA